MRNHPCFLECSDEGGSTSRSEGHGRDAETLVAEEPRGPAPEGAVRLQLSAEDGHRFSPAIDLDGNDVLAFANTDEQEEVGHDGQLGGVELLAQLPVGQGPFELQASEPGDGDPGLDDAQVVLKPSTGNTPDNSAVVGEAGLPGGTQAVHVLLALLGRQDREEAGVEQPPKSDRGGVTTDAGEGVGHEVRRAGDPEARQGVQHSGVALGEHGGDTAAAAMAELATGGRGHGKSGFFTGKPQIGQGTYPAVSRQIGQGAKTQPSTRLPQRQSQIP